MTEKKQEIQFPLPGISRIASSEHSFFYRFLWLLFILACVATCFYQVTSRVLLYLKKETAFSPTILINDTVRLPAITVCTPVTYSSYQLKKEYWQQHNMSSACDDVQRWGWTYLVGFKGKDVFEIQEAYQAKEIIKKTEFKQGSLINSKETKIKQNTVISYLGFCETFDISENLIRYIYGHNNYFIIRTTDFVKDYPCHYAALKILVHSPFETIKHVVYREGIDINYGLLASILITYEKVIFLNTTEKPCTDSESYHSCRDQCIDDFLAANRTCRLPFLNVDLPYCKDVPSTDGIHWRISDLYRRDVNCSHCGRKCIEETYGAMLTPFAFDKKGVEIHLYYEDNFFVIHEEKITYDLWAFLAELAGNVGLFTGICVLHLLEIMDDLAATMLRKAKKKIIK